jgi:acyl-CoA reductase-like NAD-dependent aldehyde dehydrogenase
VLYLIELLHEIGLPKGVINVVTRHGSMAGEALARHHDVDLIAFTGSTETGRWIIKASKTNIKRLQLELGGQHAGGYYVQPTIFANVNMNMTIAREEIFGPVVSIIPFDTIDDAVRIGNQTEYGLAGAVWSQNISTALNVVNQIKSGVMWVNGYGLIDPLVGFNGLKMSGYGANGSAAHLDTYLSTKSVYIQH